MVAHALKHFRDDFMADEGESGIGEDVRCSGLLRDVSPEFLLPLRNESFMYESSSDLDFIGYSKLRRYTIMFPIGLLASVNCT